MFQGRLGRRKRFRRRARGFDSVAPAARFLVVRFYSGWLFDPTRSDPTLPDPSLSE